MAVLGAGSGEGSATAGRVGAALGVRGVSDFGVSGAATAGRVGAALRVRGLSGIGDVGGAAASLSAKSAACLSMVKRIAAWKPCQGNAL